jgi:streptomycin 6-kinase
VARLLKEWLLIPGDVLPGGTHALVFACRRADGSPAVLKLPFVDDENRTEADALRLYDGDGAVRLLDYDPASGGMLLEHLVPGTPLLDLRDRARALDIASRLLRRLRRPVPPDHHFPLLRDLAAEWAEDIPDRQARSGEPLPHDIVDRASGFARDYGQCEREAVLVNRDTHLGNILTAGREPWLLIDPKPVVGEAAFDGSFLLLRNLDEKPTTDAAAALAWALADSLAVDRLRLRDWALVRAVDNVLWAMERRDSHLSASWLSRARALAEVG